MLKHSIINQSEDINLLLLAQASKDERLAKSFKQYKISNPDKTFSILEYIDRFKDTWVDMTVLNNAEFLSLYFQPTILKFLHTVAKNWAMIDKVSSLGIKERHIYLIKKFIVQPIERVQQERFIKDAFLKYKGVSFEYMENVDFIVVKNKIKIPIKIKETSFFLKKNETSALYCFLIKGDVYIVVRDKDTEHRCKFVLLKDFIHIFDKKISEASINELIDDTRK